jgi:hypothetical protein
MQIDEENIDHILVNMVLEKKKWSKLMGPMVLWM